jgi:FAD/FMN-containing dehydrogenase
VNNGTECVPLPNGPCAELTEILGSQQVYCDMQEYDSMTFTNRRGVPVIGFNFGNQNCDGSLLQVVVRPRDATDVSKVVKYVSESNEKLKLSIRSGGHSYTCNAIKPNSIHLDMRSLDNIEMIDNTIDTDPFNTEGKLLRVGTGNTFGNIFSVVDKDKYSFLHGECYSVGVGGFYLHGGANAGIGSLKYGFGNETIHSMKMVTGDGSILTFTEPRTRQKAAAEGGITRYDRDPVQVTDEAGTPPRRL